MNPSPESLAYLARINRAIDVVRRDLGRPLRLETIAAAAGLSPFHFHRIFKAMTGETLQQFVKRQRLERALHHMSHSPQRPLTAIALDCGFASSSDFSRSFKQHYGASPRSFDLESYRRAHRETFERLTAEQNGGVPLAEVPAGHNPDGFTATVRDLPARSVAYIRVPDPFRPGVARAACERLMRWADERGMGDHQWLGYMWDEPEVVPLRKCRYDVAVVADAFIPDGEIGQYTFPAMQVAEVMVRGDLALETRAIDWLYNTWLPQSGLLPDDQPAFEAWVGRPFAHGDTYFEIAVQLPVRPAWRVS